MNPEAQEVLNKILAKEPTVLTEDEAKFLRARRDYLKKSQLEEYVAVLNPKVENQTSDEETVKKSNAKSK